MPIFLRVMALWNFQWKIFVRSNFLNSLSEVYVIWLKVSKVIGDMHIIKPNWFANFPWELWPFEISVSISPEITKFG